MEALISIKPKYAESIFLGLKTIELRKRCPSMPAGTRLWVYVSAPTSAIVGCARVRSIRADNPERIWLDLGHQTGVSKNEFESYFEGRDVGYAIDLSEIMTLDRPVPLERIRSVLAGFHPPQSFRYLNGEAASLRLAERKLKKLDIVGSGRSV